MSPLKEHVIIVTGAARGIGKTIAETVARQGGHVIVTDILTDEAEAVAAGITASGGSATAFTLDITRPEDAEVVAGKIVERFGRIDGLVNNAALDAPHGRKTPRSSPERSSSGSAASTVSSTTRPWMHPTAAPGRSARPSGGM
ncbi:SDR family NAD(P)-dependent oxidoreductase [Sinorhizobium medicae]|uniref:SDR family NAD(P)-dependent oxidoreductase n=1 Tax=Sinorhizobium medicae TaxID=110321 RepID=UPI0030860D09|nr:SDR family NAD(P)-dependent oxidoreductase [Sinorhizobium medicae]